MIKRYDYVTLRATKEEIECLKDLAEMYDLNVSDFLRMLVVERLEEEGYRG